MLHTKRHERIYYYQAAGFLGLITLSWLNELIHLPRLLFGSETATNWHEAALETLALLTVWLATALLTRRITRHLHYVEGLLRICAWCRRVHLNGEWLTLEAYVKRGFKVDTSHGMCPECEQRAQAELAHLGNQ